MSSLEQNQEEINYRRLHYLVIKHGTFVLRSKFDGFIPSDQLHTTLQTKKNTGRINYAIKNNIINPKQHAKLSTNEPNSKDFDITLLIYLLRHLCGLDTNSQWWTKQENNLIPKANSDIEADIVRIRNIRNKLHHTTNGSLDKLEFESDWALAEEVLLRLAGQCDINDMKQKIDEVKAATNEPKYKYIHVYHRDDDSDEDNDVYDDFDYDYDMDQYDHFEDDYDDFDENDGDQYDGDEHDEIDYDIDHEDNDNDVDDHDDNDYENDHDDNDYDINHDEVDHDVDHEDNVDDHDEIDYDIDHEDNAHDVEDHNEIDYDHDEDRALDIDYDVDENDYDDY